MAIFQQGMFSTDPNMTPEQLAKKREAIMAMMPQFGNARYVGQGVGQALTGIAAGIRNRKMDKFEAQKRKEAQDQFNAAFSANSGGFSQPFAAPQGAPQGPQPDYSGGAVTQQSLDPNDPQNIANDTMTALGMTPQDKGTTQGIANDTMSALGMAPQDPWAGKEHVRNGIFAGESGGDYNALFGFSNRGGPFANVNLTNMTVGDALNFADPNGQYGQWVKGKVGRVATPMGAYQVVGSTLRDAVKAGIVSPNDKFDQSTQDKVGRWILDTQGTGAWEGYKGPQQNGAQGGAQYTQASYTQPAQASGGSGFSDAELLQAASNPWLPQQYRAMAQAELDKRQKQSDPMYQLQLQKLQQDLQPKPGYRIIDAQSAQQMGLDPSKAYQRGPDGKVSQIGGGGVNVTVGGDNSPGLGKLSSDYGYVLDPATGKPVIDPKTGLPQAAPIPGSPAALEAQNAGKQEQMRQDQATRAGSIVMQDINRALEQSNGWGTTGFLGGLSDGVGGTPAHDLQATLQTIKGNIGFDRLQQMRDASPTGGALGQVSEQEMATLQAVLGNLDQSQSREQLQRNLKRLQEVYAGIMRKASAYPNADQFGFNAQGSGGDEELFKKYGVQ